MKIKDLLETEIAPAVATNSKLHTLYKRKDKIDTWLWANDITNYTINSDGTVDVAGDVDLRNRYLRELKVQFGEIRGNFDLGTNYLTSLLGCPHKVMGDFDAYTNRLGSLQHGPAEVGGSYDADDNNLNTLLGAPKQIGGSFRAENNYLRNLQHGPIKVMGSYMCDKNPINTIEWMPEEVGQDFVLTGNFISSLRGISNKLKKLGSSFVIDLENIKEGGLGLLLVESCAEIWSPIIPKPFKIIQRYLDMPNKSNLLFECQAELIENGFEEFAQL